MAKIGEYKGPKASQTLTTTIAASAVMNTKSPAAAFYLIETDGELVITAEGRSEKTYDAQTGEVFDKDSELPENLQINNKTGADITFTLWFGFGEFVDKRKQVSVVGTIDQNLKQLNGNTVQVGNGAAGTGTLRVAIASDSAAANPLTDAELRATAVPVSGPLTDAQLRATAVPVSQPTTSVNNLNSANTTNATSVKGTAGTVYSIVASNINAAVRYLKLYNKATAPTVGTDVPVLTLAIPLSGFLNVNFGALGCRFTTGIAFALTTGAADSDTGAVAADEIKVNINYI